LSTTVLYSDLISAGGLLNEVLAEAIQPVDAKQHELDCEMMFEELPQQQSLVEHKQQDAGGGGSSDVKVNGT